MNITLNGKPHELDGAVDVITLLKSLNVKPEQVAVAINGEVVPRREWPRTGVSEGDAVEVVRAVGGGAR
jgi:sulfur carrier protein